MSKIYEYMCVCATEALGVHITLLYDESWTRIGFQIFCDTIKNMLVGLSLKHIFSVSTVNNFTFSCERENGLLVSDFAYKSLYIVNFKHSTVETR